MLTGNYKHNVDTKNRLFVPSKFREELQDNFVISPSIRDGHLNIYSAEKWEEYIAPFKQNVNRALAESALRFLNGNACVVSPDGQGRIILPPQMLKYASITKGTVIVGCGDYAEIWSEEVYNKNQEELDVQSLRDALEALGL